MKKNMGAWLLFGIALSLLCVPSAFALTFNMSARGVSNTTINTFNVTFNTTDSVSRGIISASSSIPITDTSTGYNRGFIYQNWSVGVSELDTHFSFYNATMMYRIGNIAISNSTIPSACITPSRIQTRAGSSSNWSAGLRLAIIQCYNGTDWETIPGAADSAAGAWNEVSTGSQFTNFYDGNYSTYTNFNAFTNSWVASTDAVLIDTRLYENNIYPVYAVSRNYTTTNGTIQAVTNATNASITFRANGYYAFSASGVSTASNYTANLTTRQIFITIKEESSNAVLSVVNVTLKALTANTENTYTTTNGTYTISEVIAGQYTIKGSASGYAERSYQLQTNELSNSNITIYLSNSSSNVTFNVKDEDVATLPIEEAIISMARIINSSWTTVQSGYSDITGAAVFSYTPGVRYRFTASKSGYESKIFYLDPIQYNQYDIYLNKIAVLNDTQDFAYIAIVIGPKKYYNDENNTMLFTITSPSGTLTEYGYTVTYPGGSATNTGTSSSGEILSSVLSITGASALSNVNISYYYVSEGRTRNFTANYPISLDISPERGAFNEGTSNLFGLGDFERILIATVIVLIVAGAAGIYAGAIAAGLTIMLMYGLLYFSGLVPLWSMLIVLAAGFITVVWRGSQ